MVLCSMFPKAVHKAPNDSLAIPYAIKINTIQINSLLINFFHLVLPLIIDYLTFLLYPSIK